MEFSSPAVPVSGVCPLCSLPWWLAALRNNPQGWVFCTRLVSLPREKFQEEFLHRKGWSSIGKGLPREVVEISSLEVFKCSPGKPLDVSELCALPEVASPAISRSLDSSRLEHKLHKYFWELVLFGHGVFHFRNGMFSRLINFPNLENAKNVCSCEFTLAFESKYRQFSTWWCFV